MKHVFRATILLLLSGCAKEVKVNDDIDFTDRVITFAVDHPEDTFVEMPGLYETHATHIPQAADEQFILAEKLEARGFKVVDTGSVNNQLSGRRMATLTLVKDNCECEVDKVYYSTLNVSQYVRTERIKCRRMN
jgi:hypothetical protein